MGFAKSVAAGYQRDCLFVIHSHAEERLTNVFRRCERVGVAVRPFGVDVDQAHLDRTKRLRQLTLSAIPFVAKPGPFGTPVELLRFPNVSASSSKPESL